jgi:hypothetical protein
VSIAMERMAQQLEPISALPVPLLRRAFRGEP